MTKPFFDRLLSETAAQRDAFLSIPFIQHGWRGELSLETYLAFLGQAYHHVKHTTPLLMACGSPRATKREWLRDAMAEYVDEEVGHQEWILNDINACGGDAEQVRRDQPGAAAELMVAYAYHTIDRGNPVGFLGMVLVLEGTSVRVATEAAANLKRNLGLPAKAFSYPEQSWLPGCFAYGLLPDLVDRLDDPRDQDCVIHCAKRFYGLYGDVFRALPLALNAAAHAA